MFSPNPRFVFSSPALTRWLTCLAASLMLLSCGGGGSGGSGGGASGASPSSISLTLPHTGITTSQCFKASSDDLVGCDSTEAKSLNSEQDGMRTRVNPRSYSLVAKAGGGTYALTECVKDNVTGLIWEGKTDSSSNPSTTTNANDPQRVGGNIYTNYDSSASGNGQKGSSTDALPSDVIAPTNSVGYVKYVNSKALCGYTDWRLPDRYELRTLVDYSVVSPGPTINSTWFQNTYKGFYWTSAPSLDNSDKAWNIDFETGAIDDYDRGDSYAVRLVRASP